MALASPEAFQSIENRMSIFENSCDSRLPGLTQILEGMKSGGFQNVEYAFLQALQTLPSVEELSREKRTGADIIAPPGRCRQRVSR